MEGQEADLEQHGGSKKKTSRNMISYQWGRHKGMNVFMKPYTHRFLTGVLMSCEPPS